MNTLPNKSLNQKFARCACRGVTALSLLGGMCGIRLFVK